MCASWPAQAEKKLLGETLDQHRPVPLDIPFQTRGGKALTLADFKGKIVALNFWATWCEPCVDEMPALQRLANDYKDEGFALVAVAEDFRGFETIERFLVRHRLHAIDPYWDERNRLFNAFQIRGLPATVMIDRQGREIGRVIGFVDWDGKETRDFIETLIRPTIENTEVPRQDEWIPADKDFQ